MADNLVSQPPLNTPIVEANGLPSKVFAIWLRDIYRRTAYTGGNAIDDNKKEIDEAIECIDGALDTLDEVIVVVIDHEERIDVLEDGVDDHIAAEEAHDSNGNIVGFNDLADDQLVDPLSGVSVINAIPVSICN